MLIDWALIFISMSVPSRTVHSNRSVTDFHKCMMCNLLVFSLSHLRNVCLGLVGDFGSTCSCVCPVNVHVTMLWPLTAVSLIHLSFCLLHVSLVSFSFFFCTLHRMQTSCIRVSLRSSPLFPLSTLHLFTNREVMRIRATPIAGLTLPLVKKWCIPAGGVAPTTALSALSSDLGETPGCPGWRTPTLHLGLKLPSEMKV